MRVSWRRSSFSILAVFTLVVGYSLVSPAPSGTSAAAASTAVASCSARQVSLSLVRGLAGAGHWSQIILVMNGGPTTCRLTGYPGVRMLDGLGQVIGTPIETRTGFSGGLQPRTPIPVIELQPGEAAAAVLEGIDIPGGDESSCPSYDSLDVALPDQTLPVTIHQGGTVCPGLYVHPFVLGFNGSYPTGEVVGRTLTCRLSASGGSSIGPLVPIAAWSGTTLSGEVGLSTNSTATQRYQLTLKPGKYRIVSGRPRSALHVTVQAGRIDNLGRYGTCILPGPPKVAFPDSTTSVP
jgi:Protein of unknown function (DUF4232)